MIALLGRVILIIDVFPFIILRISCHSLLACRVSVERSAGSLMEIPIYGICCFSFTTFNIFSLCLTFVSLINTYLDVLLFLFIVYGILGFLDLGSYLLSHVWEVFNYKLNYFFSYSFFFMFSSSRTPVI